MDGSEERRTLVGTVKTLVKVAVAVGLAVGLGFLFKFLYEKYIESKRTIPTLENNIAIAKGQLGRLDPIYLKRDLAGARGDKPLINYTVLGCRNAGYLGPSKSGVFSERDAIRIAIRAGCRAFCLNIGQIEKVEGPVLTVRTKNGDLISNNVGSINKVCQALVNYAPRNEPIILFLYFESLPTNNPYSPPAMKFMMNVATALKPLKNRHLGLTSEADYRRQKMQDGLFLKNISQFEGKFIILTNVDTSGFKPGVIPNMAGIPPITTDNDLDLWTHARVFTYVSTSLGITSTVGASKVSGPRVETDDYFTAIPPDRMVETVANSRVNWTIAMNSGIDMQLRPPSMLKKMMDECGVSCVMTDVFNDGLFADKQILSKDYFGVSGWREKPQPLQYVRPADIILSVPNPQLNAQGGFVQSPTA